MEHMTVILQAKFALMKMMAFDASVNPVSLPVLVAVVEMITSVTIFSCALVDFNASILQVATNAFKLQQLLRPQL
jgi:hypothetical protein